MTESEGNNAPKTRGRPFARGNPGRPKGARHKVSVAVEDLLAGEAEALTRRAIERAMAGCPVALRMCLDRIAPPRREASITVDLPAINTPADAPGVIAALLAKISTGEIAPGEAQAIAGLLEAFRKASELADIETRLAKLEEKA